MIIDLTGYENLERTSREVPADIFRGLESIPSSGFMDSDIRVSTAQSMSIFKDVPTTADVFDNLLRDTIPSSRRERVSRRQKKIQKDVVTSQQGGNKAGSRFGHSQVNLFSSFHFHMHKIGRRYISVGAYI